MTFSGRYAEMTPTPPMPTLPLLENPVWLPESRIMLGIRMEMNALMVTRKNPEADEALLALAGPERQESLLSMREYLAIAGNTDLDQQFQRRDKIAKQFGMIRLGATYNR